MMHLLGVKLKRLSLIFIIVLTIITLYACDGEDPPVTNMNLISDITLKTESPTTNEKVEFELLETSTYTDLGLNPFDYRDVYIQGVFTSPSNDILTIPAFWYQDHNIVFNENWPVAPSGIAGVASTNPDEPQGMETFAPIGDPHFRIRYLPKETGLYTLDVIIKMNDQIVQSLRQSFEVTEGSKTYHGVISVEPNFNRNFIYEDGTTFIPVGQNLGWFTSSTRQTEDYRVWMSLMHDNQANFTRIWMAPWSFALHWGTSYDNFTSRLSNASKLDKVIDLAENYDIHFMLTLLNHGQFSAYVNPQWDQNPWNAENGGILDYPAQFFTKVEAKETYKQQLLYIIGRYGYTTHLMAWELFNEVDWTDNFSATAVYLWHSEMASFIKDNDPYQHMTTTSYKGTTGGSYMSSTIDFSNAHDYGYYGRNVMQSLSPVQDQLFNTYDKPTLHLEIGSSWDNGAQQALADPTGILLKQSQWAGIMGGGAGAAMNWWWDSWVHPNDLYHRFIGIGKYAARMDMTGTHYDQLRTLNGVTINNSNVGLIGYRMDQRVYGYTYDKDWTHLNSAINQKNVSYTIPLTNGSYQLSIYDTNTGDIIETRSLIIANGIAQFSLSFTEDLAFIILEV